jgi:hypothetical protein
MSGKIQQHLGSIRLKRTLNMPSMRSARKAFVIRTCLSCFGIIRGQRILLSKKCQSGTAAGATTGVVIGGVLGWLVGVGALAIPGIGPLIVAGPPWPL